MDERFLKKLQKAIPWPSYQAFRDAASIKQIPYKNIKDKGEIVNGKPIQEYNH